MAQSLYQLSTVTNPVVSPDGTKAILVVTNLDEHENTYQSHLYVIDIKTGKQTKLTQEKGKHVAPQWLPSGDGYTYLSNREGKNQVFLKQGLADAKQVTYEEHGILSYMLAPDGATVAYSTFFKESEENEQARQKPEPLVIDQMKYKSDQRGLHDDRVMRIGSVDLRTDKQQWLTTDQYDSQLLDFSGDSRHILFASDRAENRDFSFSAHAYLINMDTKQERQVTKEVQVITGGAVSPDGQTIALLSHQREYENATLPKINIYRTGTVETLNLTENVDHFIGDIAIGDFLQQTGSNRLRFSNDGQSLYTLVSSEGAVNVWRFSLNGDQQKLTNTDAHINGFDFYQDEFIVTHSSVVEPSECYHVSNKDKALNRLTTFNEAFEEEFQVSVPEKVNVSREDGSFVEGWLMKPTFYEEGQTYPLILEVHGGPHAMYANTYFHEFQMLTAKGYGVLYTNPRGSHGYGQAFVDAVRGDYGGGDFQDLMDILDDVVKTNSWVDESRLGMTGGSYGGFMTNWAVGHTNRFKAAVTQRSISNWISFYGVSDIGYYFSDWQIKAELDEMETLWQHSPIKYVANVETPLLILHGENDLRCPIEQAEQLFIALKRLGKQTRFIRFPEANHELSRSGKPSLRVKRLEAILGWFEEYLS
ncbi:LOW QUALITY PROTEIN: acylamino-acid-releasing enzyme [Bacillus sp. JCM 19047]|nr:LOW QUALITY PROTEIN: acylamino-acid-releasing enzyme [Bacillus sp. JCM 19047]